MYQFTIDTNADAVEDLVIQAVALGRGPAAVKKLEAIRSDAHPDSTVASHETLRRPTMESCDLLAWDILAGANRPRLLVPNARHALADARGG